jgi:V/A-type H+-transporting ATPase subunit I
LRSNIRASSHYLFLSLAAGAVATQKIPDFKKDLEAFSAVVLVLHEGEVKTDVLVISMKRDAAEIKALFNKHGFTEVQVAQEMLGVSEEVTATIDKKVLTLTAEQALLKDESRVTIAKERDNLLALWENLKLNELYYKIQSSFSTTARTVIFSGWVPASKKLMIEEGIAEVTRGHHFIEWKDPEGIEKETHKKVKVPVQLKNFKFLSPFQMLVTYYSTPEYGTVDPTPFVSILYLIMFGFMFADVGQGLVLILVGLGARIFGKRLKAGMSQIMRLIVFCGGAAVISGALFGSYFGFPLFKPLWFDFHGIIAGHIPASSPVQSVLDILSITLYFGIFVIAVGLVFNWINLIRTRHWSNLFFDRTGIAGGALYLGGVYTGYYFVTHNYKVLPDPLLLFLFVGVPALFLIGKSITEFIEERHLDPSLRFTVFTPFFFIFQWILELLEVFAGFLSNTLSFMRVAGMGIAHVALMMSFFEMARMLGSAGGYSVGSYIILIVGNAFVIALEGLTAGIQSLRLNYYEFFSKFFRGSGEAYAPVSLKDS